MPMKNPLHPGDIVLHECIEPLEISVADAAAHLRVDAQALADICAGRSQISADMAIRLERAFGSTADTWLRMQASYDLARARETAEANGLTEIERFG